MHDKIMVSESAVRETLALLNYLRDHADASETIAPDTAYDLLLQVAALERETQNTQAKPRCA